MVLKCDNAKVDLAEYHCSTYGGSDSLRVAIVGSYTLWTLACELGLARGHPFVWFANTVIVRLWSMVVDVFRLGPQAKSKVE